MHRYTKLHVFLSRYQWLNYHINLFYRHFESCYIVPLKASDSPSGSFVCNCSQFMICPVIQNNLWSVVVPSAMDLQVMYGWFLPIGRGTKTH